MTDPKETLHRYLKRERESVLWKLDGLTDKQVRWPMTPTGTNLLGLVKHLASVELGYFGDTFGRPAGERQLWSEDDPNADMYAAADETREDIVALYQRATAHADATIEALDLDAQGAVPWWPEERRTVTLHQILVHMVTETARHAGHADIVRELSDGGAGLRDDNSNLPDGVDWPAYVAELERIADQA